MGNQQEKSVISTKHGLIRVEDAERRARYHTLLLRKGWKQQDLADAVGVDKALISRIINGRTEPSPTVLIKISEALDVDSSVLLYQEFKIPEGDMEG